MNTYCESIGKKDVDLSAIENEVRVSGSKVIELKGATYYAIAMSVSYICKCILRDTNSILVVSTMVNNRYGINDVCLSLPVVVGKNGIVQKINPPLLPEEEKGLQISAQTLREVIESVNI